MKRRVVGKNNSRNSWYTTSRNDAQNAKSEMELPKKRKTYEDTRHWHKQNALAFVELVYPGIQ